MWMGVERATWTTVSDASNQRPPSQPENPTVQLQALWRDLVEDLPTSQKAFLLGSRAVTMHESTAIIAVADEFTRNQLEGRLRIRLEDSLSRAFDRQIRLAVTVEPELGEYDGTGRRDPDRDRAPGEDLPGPSTAGEDQHPFGVSPHGHSEYGGAPGAASPGPGSHEMSTNPLDHPTPAPRIPEQALGGKTSRAVNGRRLASTRSTSSTRS